MSWEVGRVRSEQPRIQVAHSDDEGEIYDPCDTPTCSSSNRYLSMRTCKDETLSDFNLWPSLITQNITLFPWEKSKCAYLTICLRKNWTNEDICKQVSDIYCQLLGTCDLCHPLFLKRKLQHYNYHIVLLRFRSSIPNQIKEDPLHSIYLLFNPCHVFSFLTFQLVHFSDFKNQILEFISRLLLPVFAGELVCSSLFAESHISNGDYKERDPLKCRI